MPIWPRAGSRGSSDLWVWWLVAGDWWLVLVLVLVLVLLRCLVALVMSLAMRG